jgi:hypothetical protein
MKTKSEIGEYSERFGRTHPKVVQVHPVQVSEFVFYDANGASVKPVCLRVYMLPCSTSFLLVTLACLAGFALQTALLNPGGDNPTSEGPSNLIDGDTSTKWVDFNRQPVIFDFGEGGVNLATYTWATANDTELRDPIQWR